MNVKYSKGLDFPNLPYFIDGQVRLSQSHAIMRYIARKHGLAAKSDGEQTRLDLLTEQCMDFRNGWVTLVYGRNGTYEQQKESYIAGLPAKFKAFEDFLGANPWFAGANITFVDFHMYELLWQHSKFVPEIIAKYPKLGAYVKRFEDLPKIKAYLASPRFQNLPMNVIAAGFGGTTL